MGLYHTEETWPNGVRQVALVGMLDSDEAMKNGEELRQFILGQGGKVLLDLAKLTYLSSAGMRVLVGAIKDLHERSGEMHIAAAEERVMAVITIGGITELCSIYRTLEEAHTALGVR